MIRYLSAILFALLWLGGENVYAAQSNLVQTPHVQARLVADHDAISADGSIKIGLFLKLKPGWHSYWINPGAAGEPPHFDLKISGGSAKIGPINWPAPQRLKEGDLTAYAYNGDVLLSRKTVIKAQKDISIKAHAQWLVCATICVPEEGDFTLALPLFSQPLEAQKETVLFKQAEQKLPQLSPFRARLSSDGKLILEGEELSPQTISQAYFFPEESGFVNPDAPQNLRLSKGKLSLSLKADSSLKGPLGEKPIRGVLFLKDVQGQESYLNITTEKTLSSFKDAKTQKLGLILLFAFLGGIILNAMPCVFPILAMKILSLSHLKDAERRERQKSAFYYTLGVIISFAFLGAVLIILRALGASIGWGFQFQSPYFVAAMGWGLMLLALNLFGVFHIGLGRLGVRLGTIASHNQALEEQTNKTHQWQEMVTGFLAVFVATPCTAPFMGVAIAAALSHSAFIGVFIFVVMGLGLALPYILLANVPRAVNFLPRSGAWMEVFKQFLAFPLLATSLWLLWIGTVQVGPHFIVFMTTIAICLALAGWFYGLAQRNDAHGGKKNFSRFCYGGIVMALGASAAILVFTQGSVVPDGGLREKINATSSLPSGWETFSQKRLEELRNEGRPVLVDMTASWCITCLVNERVALKSPSVSKAFKDHNVVILVGDWTRRDTEITQYLNKYGRDGVPLYVYYEKRRLSAKGEAKEKSFGKILPQVLTPSSILAILNHPS
ncbi:protein-disulfide reductase DsbD family protein [Aristophania vespae]|uniref:protein-disulfide reductase DsbD family protein n=1 Tax=Aristophania vespae TaxID=2697033 RepID=UPI00235188BE|nr:thioredoxin family protein [Aristophania vespae]UMM63949.1 Thiol:disulfide interchange protein DsbD [Aristophania vespae]